MGQQELQAVLQSLAGNALDAQGAAQSYATKAVTKPTSPATFDQSANSTTALVVPAAVSVGSLVLLADTITAIGTLQTAVNTNIQLINKLIDIAQAAGLAL